MKKITLMIVLLIFALTTVNVKHIVAGQLPSPRVFTYPYIANTGDPADNEPAEQNEEKIISANADTAVGSLGLGSVECWNCAPFKVKVKLSHYDPMSGEINCWDYDKERKYCYSPTKPGIHWKGLWGFGAACPFEWPYGTWVSVPQVGNFICFDRGGEIKCADGICNVDILTNKSGWWDGKVFDVTIWVPLDPPRK